MRTSFTRYAQTTLTKGFTLLELLVVVVILTVLLALFLPKLSLASQKAKRSACGGQLHGLAAGFAAYVSDNGNVLPYAALMPSVNTRPALPLVMIREVTSPKAWRCPADNIGYVRPSDNQQFSSYFDGETLSYEYNMTIGGTQVTKYFLYPKLGDSGTYLLADFDSFHGDRGAVNSKNILFFDGHVGDVTDIADITGGPMTQPASTQP